MAKSDAVWGIDIGQCALKALRCRPHEKGDRIVADAFDYIEYPQILSQPGADPNELVEDALSQFLSRNSVHGDTVVVSVPGHSGLARFIKLPPVEAKKIPDIVRYEARQQIPFDLRDVIWDYQRMGVSSDQEGFALETEVGLFAIKRDIVFQTLQPLLRAAVDVHMVQLSPLALYNCVRFDALTDVPRAEDYDPENPPDSTAILSVGAEATDLVITDGIRVWQRSLPLGGNHFTTALTKELKLTFSKAEHLKRNATSAQDPKALFQAMRSAFNELSTELQRSVSYFSSIERKANLTRVLAVGNAMKLPGLRKILEQNLGIPVSRLESYRGLTGSSVVSVPAFQENMASFAVCYGLCLQGLKKSAVWTNLLPREILQDRMLREKKPWAVAGAAILLLGATLSFVSHSRALNTVDKGLFKAAEGKADQVASESGRLKTEFQQLTEQFQRVDAVGKNLVSNIEGRLLWLELLKALSECLPRDLKPADGQPAAPKEIDQRNELHITSLDCERLDELGNWFNKVKQYYQPGKGEKIPKDGQAPGAAPQNNEQPPGDENAPPEEGQAEGGGQGAGAGWGPQGPGYVLRLNGVHYHNSTRPGEIQGAQFVRSSFLNRIQDPKFKVQVPTADGKIEMLSMKELGLSYPVLVQPGGIVTKTLDNPYAAMAVGGEGASKEVREFRFTIEIAWKPTPASSRAEQKQKPGENQAKPNE